MRAIWLIGVNFVREQRIVLLVFVGWIFGLAAIFGFLQRGRDPEDILSLFRQQASYGIAYSLLVAVSALHGERKSRRILAVLSKGIYRGEYLAGLMLGNALLAGIYMACVGIVNTWLALRFGFQISFWSTLGAAWLASVLSGAVALFFGTFLHPALATAGTSFALAAPFLVSWKLGANWEEVIPVDYVIRRVFSYTYSAGWQGTWSFVPIAIAEIIVLGVSAAMIFAKRDVTVAIE